MRIMAVDFGDTRTGIAVSDATGTITGGAWVVTEKNLRVLVALIVSEAENREVKRIVVGRPLNMDGSVGARAEKSDELVESLREKFPDVVTWDERLTTVAAHSILSEHNIRGKKRKKTIDAVAASLILDGYLHSL